jgi:phage terminase large subunit-like protein
VEIPRALPPRVPTNSRPRATGSVWLYLAGRGSGKTRAGVEWVRRKIKQGSRRIALIAPTTSAARDVLIEGESGILAHAWEHDRDDLGNVMGRPVYEPSKRRLTWGNGAIATAFSAEEPDRLRGPQHDCILADELAAWSKVKSATAADPVQSSYAWDMAMMGLRIGRRPQAMVATTPRPIPILRELMRSPACAVTRATTFANRANLAFFEHIISKYRGTRLGRQELMGDILEEAEGALWTREMVEQARDATVSSNVPISIVHASRSKQARAEPVAALYEQRKVTHLAAFPELDDQLCTWEPLSGDPSPDRLDALVWGLSELMLGAAEPPIVMPFFAGTPRNIPGQNYGVGT